jgi:hypothetical protein
MKKPSGISRVARGTLGEVVSSAQRQIFAPADTIHPVPDGAPGRSLQRVLCELLESEINAGLQTFAFDIVRVSIGDELNGIEAQAELMPRNPARGTTRPLLIGCMRQRSSSIRKASTPRSFGRPRRSESAAVLWLSS